MPALCVVIVVLYAAARLVRATDRAGVAARLGLLACAAWVGEDSMVRAYGYYRYSRHLGPLLDVVPVLVPLIWAVVIDSACGLARRIATRRVPLVAGAIVLCDAALIEPVAVRAGLWSWVEGGLFDVPFVGLFGWAAFTAAAVLVHERSAPRLRAPMSVIVAVVVPALLTHAAILASWWAGFRWLRGPIAPATGAAFVWVVLPALAVVEWRRGLRRRVPIADMLVRVPGAVFFYALLVAYGWDDNALVAYAAAFTWPYLALVDPTRAQMASTGGAAPPAQGVQPTP